MCFVLISSNRFLPVPTFIFFLRLYKAVITALPICPPVPAQLGMTDSCTLRRSKADIQVSACVSLV